ncbi:MAG: FtsK/SpoIIIE domain-containing protein [Chloroflexota bacterium]
MSSGSLIQEQRELVRKAHAAIADRGQEESSARELFRREILTAETSLNATHTAANEQLQVAKTALAEAQRVMGKTPEIKAVPPDAAPPDDLLSDIMARNEKIKGLLDRLKLGRAEDERLKAGSSSMITGLVVGAAGGLVILVLMFFGLGTSIGRSIMSPGMVMGLSAAVLIVVGAVVFTLSGGAPQRKFAPERDFPQLCNEVAHLMHRHEALLEESQATFERRVGERRAHLDQTLLSITERIRQQPDSMRSDIAHFTDNANGVALEWKHPSWSSWTIGSGLPPAVCIGELRPDESIQTLAIPALVEFPGQKALLFRARGAPKEEAIHTAQSLIYRLLATSTPGNIRLTMIAPHSSAHVFDPLMRLGIQNRSLVTHRVWSDPQQIVERLTELTKRVDELDRHISDRFDSLAEYNARTGSVETHRAVIVIDYPIAFNAASVRALRRIAERGPRRGMFLAIVADPVEAEKQSVDLRELVDVSTVIDWDGRRWVWQDEDFSKCALELDRAPDSNLATKIVQHVGQAARS